MSKVVEKDKGSAATTARKKSASRARESDQRALDSLEARMEAIESHLDKLVATIETQVRLENVIRVLEIGDKIVCIYRNDVLFATDKSDEEAMQIVFELTDPRTIRALEQDVKMMEQYRADRVK